MTVATATAYFTTPGDGVTTVFAYAARLLEESGLIVELVNSAGAITAQVLGVDYTVAIATDGQSASVTFTTAPAAGYAVVRRRRVDYLQPTQLPAHGRFPSDLTEEAFDRVVLMLQAVRDTGNRGIRLAESDSPDLATLPPLSTMLGKYLAISLAGNPIATVGTAGDPIAAAWLAVIQSASLSLGLTAMGFSTYFQTLPAAADAAALRALLGVDEQSKAIDGLTYGNNAGDVVNDIDIAAGVAIDTAAGRRLALAATLTKRLDAAWAAGTNQGGLDSGAIANADYCIWLIGRTDGAAVDVLFSLSATAPTMPPGYTYKRLIGWFKRVANAIVIFTTYETEGGGIELLWKEPTLDVNQLNALTTARRTDAVKAPLNFSTEALLNVVVYDALSNFRVWICCPDQADVAPSASIAPLANISQTAGVQGTAQAMRIRTSAAGLIAARSDFAIVDLYTVSTVGLRWSRR